MYIHDCVTLLYDRNWHNIVNFKCTLKERERKRKKEKEGKKKKERPLRVGDIWQIMRRAAEACQGK